MPHAPVFVERELVPTLGARPLVEKYGKETTLTWSKLSFQSPTKKINGLRLCVVGDFQHYCSYETQILNLAQMFLRSTSAITQNCCQWLAFLSVQLFSFLPFSYSVLCVFEWRRSIQLYHFPKSPFVVPSQFIKFYVRFAFN